MPPLTPFCAPTRRGQLHLGASMDLFATDILIFLSNEGADSQWGAVRHALHSGFLSGVEFEARKVQLAAKLREDWVDPKLTDMNDIPKVQRMVCKCVFFVMFDVWLDDDKASILTGWRTNASAFVLPRMLQRILFNLLLNRVKKLRVDTVNIVKDAGCQEKFEQMNRDLPKQWQRPTGSKLCDEIMYVIGFAGMGGTSACVESVGQFLQAQKPAESTKIDFGQYGSPEEMQKLYKQNPEKYIKETCRLDPPVTSATQVIKEDARVPLAGREFDFPAGTYNQYVVLWPIVMMQYFPNLMCSTPSVNIWTAHSRGMASLQAKPRTNSLTPVFVRVVI